MNPEESSNADNGPPKRIPDEFVGHFRLLRTWKRKLEVANNRIGALGKFLEQDSAPRGFSKIIVPYIPTVTTEFSLKWHDIHHRFAKELTECLIDYWRQQKDQAVKEVDELERTLSTRCPKEVLQHIQEVITRQLTRQNPPENGRKRRRIDGSSEDVD